MAGTPIRSALKRTSRKLELAVTETCNHIVKPAYHGRPYQWIQTEAEGFPESVSIRLHPFGDCSILRKSCYLRSMALKRQPSGSLINPCVMLVKYCRDEQGKNCIALTMLRGSTHEIESS